MTFFRLNQALYHTFLGLWLGAMVMLVLAATAAFSFVTSAQTTLTVEVAGFGGPLLGSEANGWVAGGIVGTAIGRLEKLQLLCFAVVATATALQLTAFRHRLAAPPLGVRNMARVVLLVGPLLIVGFNLAVVGPGIDANRTLKYDPAADPAAKAQAQLAFDRFHGLSTRTYAVSTAMLLSASLLGPWCFVRKDDHADG